VIAARAVSVLESRGLSKRYGGVVAVDGVTAEFPSSTVTVIVGANGAGKTTLFQMLSGMLEPDAGDVLYHGRILRRQAGSQPQSLGIGRLFQDSRVFNRLTAIENILVALPGDLRSRVMACWGINADASNHLLGDAHRFLESVGLASEATSSAGALSTGQQRLLAIARLLAGGGDVLLMDEPSRGVSPRMQHIVADLIRDQAGAGRAVVVIEHDMNFVRAIADHVHFMNAGRIVASGNAEDVLSDPRIRSTYLGLE
jgi:ABC-type branched-subunit amino acid transport system ATPase component